MESILASRTAIATPKSNKMPFQGLIFD